MATVRVFLPTYRRPALLPRALASLRAQTFTDWICELHNDDPADPQPGRLLAALADPRITLVTHARNLGPIETFNLFYRPSPEPFFSLLEDDNTWEPGFLQGMLAALAQFPQATLAWCNQRIAHEDSTGRITLAAATVNPPEGETAPARLVSWGQPRQAMGALHANGAMLMRTRPGMEYSTPDIPFGCVEPFRERMLPHPLVYVPAALATFTVTQVTARQSDLSRWGAALVLLAATYLKHARLDDAGLAALCEHFRRQSPPMISELLAASFACPEGRAVRRQITAGEKLRFVLQFIRHPRDKWRSLRVRTAHPAWWALLDRHTADRFAPAPSS